MRLCPLEPRRQSCRFATTCPSLIPSSPIFRPWLPLRAKPRKPADSFRVTWRGLPPPGRPCLAKGQIVHSKPASERCCDHLLTKLMSPLQLYFLAVACSFQYTIRLLSRSPADLFSRFNRVWRKGPGGREVACSRGLTGPLAFVRHHVQVCCSRSLTGLYTSWRTPRKTHVRIDRARGHICSGSRHLRNAP